MDPSLRRGGGSGGRDLSADDSRALAAEVCTSYLSSVDDESSFSSVPHPENVRVVLRPHLLRATEAVLLPRRGGDDDDDDGGDDVDDDGEEDDGEKVSKSGGRNASQRLSRRSLARLDAFLGGMALAVPADPIGSSRRPSSMTPPTRSSTSNSNSNSGSSAVPPPPPPPQSAAPPVPIRQRLGGVIPALGDLTLRVRGAGAGGRGGDDSAGGAEEGVADGGNKDDDVAAATASATAVAANGTDNRANKAKGRKRRTKKQQSSSSSSSLSSSPSRNSTASSPSSTALSSSFFVYRYPQIDEDDLLLRLDLYFRTILRLRDDAADAAAVSDSGAAAGVFEECTVHVESERCLGERVDNVLRSFVGSVGCVSTIRPVLTALVDCLTREVLAVDVLGGEIVRSIQRLVAEYEMQTSFASIAFLSTPEHSAESTLGPLLLSYLHHLRNSWKDAVFHCELERSLATTLHPDLRRTFHNAEFRSIGHLLDTCREHRDALENINLPPAHEWDGGFAYVEGEDEDVTTMRKSNDLGSIASSFRMDNPDAVKQALRDLRRETITVNGRELPPAHSVRQLVCHLAEALHATSGPPPTTTAKRGGGTAAASGPGGHDPVSPASSADKRREQYMLADSESDYSLSSGSESDNGGAAGTAKERGGGDAARPEGGGSSPLVAVGDRDVGANGDDRKGTGGSSRSGGRRKRKATKFDIRTIDQMTLRLLMASCRTGAGGDAFFVVQDLFGGDDVVVVSSNCSSQRRGGADESQRSEHVRSSTRRRKRKTKEPTPTGTIELTVRLSSVVIRVHGTYNVFPQNMLDQCEPLIQLHTTTTETIALRQVRAPRAADVDAATTPNGSIGRDDDNVEGESSTLLLQERITEDTGKRILSVRPALYEKVQVWNTPS